MHHEFMPKGDRAIRADVFGGGTSREKKALVGNGVAPLARRSLFRANLTSSNAIACYVPTARGGGRVQ